jgi:hypothetical protein
VISRNWRPVSPRTLRFSENVCQHACDSELARWKLINRRCPPVVIPHATNNFTFLAWTPNLIDTVKASKNRKAISSTIGALAKSRTA